MLDTRRVTWTLGIWTALSFTICVLFALITPRSYHAVAFLEQALPGFRWLTATGFVIGLVESFLYGAYAGMTFCPIFNRVHARRTDGPAHAG